MAKTGEGDFTTRIHEGGSREICELSNSFNSMVRHIYKLIRKTYVAELNAKDARLAALEAQINPHFYTIPCRPYLPRHCSMIR